MTKHFLLLTLFCLCKIMYGQKSSDIDTSFNPTNFTFTSKRLVYPISQQLDGKILVGSNQNGIDRLNIDGSIDLSFIKSNILSNYSVDTRSILLQKDGRILFGGDVKGDYVYRPEIVRLNSDGNIDISFTGKGFDKSFEDIALQTDGKILAVGGFSTYYGVNANRILRLNSDGSLDTSFVTGIFSANIANDPVARNPYIYCVKIQPDGKILVAGGFTSYNGITSNNIARLNYDGSIDNLFESGSGFNASIESIALQPDGKILATGGFSMYNGTQALRIVRINSNGSIDNTFVKDSNFNNSTQPYTNTRILPQSDGKVLYSGYFTTSDGVKKSILFRLNANGSLDYSFSDYRGTGFNGYVRSLAIQSDGKILVGGNFWQYNGVYNYFIIRLIGTPTLSINKFSKNNLVVYPNPVKDILKFNLNTPFIKYEIYNLLGEYLISGTRETSNINVSNLKQGLYFIKLSTSEGIYNSKFLKN